MAISDFTGMRLLQISVPGATASDPRSYVTLTPANIAADGIDFQIEDNTITISSFAGDQNAFNGLTVDIATVALLPNSVAILGQIFPNAYDPATGAFGPAIGGCSTIGDADVAFINNCSGKANVLFKHVAISISNDNAISRDDPFTWTLSFAPTLSPKSEYGVSGAQATDETPFIMFNGTYDPTTSTIAYAPVA